MFKKSYLGIFVFLLVVFFGTPVVAGDVWQEIDDSALNRRPSERLVVPNSYRTFRLNRTALEAILKQAPMEFTTAAQASEVVLALPMPDGSFQRFRIVESPIVEPGLAAKFPELITYSGQGVDDPTTTVRFDLIGNKFHSQILSTRGTVLVDPYFKSGDTENYVSYNKRTVARTNDFICHFAETGDFQKLLETKETSAFGDIAAPNVISGGTLRTYRLALAATNEYAVAVGGNTIAGTLAAQVVIMNRVNGVYERDLALRMVVIANNNLIAYAGDQMCGGNPCTGANDPYANTNGVTMLGQNQTNLDTVIGSANYDIGHVFSTGGGGVATLNGPCGGSKARGVTGLPNPVGDPFSIDFVAHEMGHQWGANHTFNGATGNCSGGNRSAANAYETGSGITIMAYAGICGNQDLANNSIDTFHVRSLEVIVAFSQTGNGNPCAAATASGNTPPAVSVVGGTTFNIPKQTPFALTATGSDAENDAITYDWQEYDLGASTTAVPNTDSDGNARPIFRPYLPTVSPTRCFPSLQYILANANVPPSTYNCDGFTCLTGELLPAITRAMTFQVIARDNRANAGGINTATATVNVDGNSGPFALTAPNTGVTFPGNSQQTITWNNANTTSAPINTTHVKISLSTDGGQTFPFTLAGSTPNNGSANVTIPNVQTSTARIKVEAVGNIFFDISDANFTVNQTVAPGNRAPFDFDGDNKTDVSIFRPSVGQWWYERSSDHGVPAFQFGAGTDKPVPADFTGDAKADLAFWRPSTGEWFVLRSEDFSYFAFPWGTMGDIPVPGDYDGDGKADAAIFRPSESTWYIQKSGGGITIQGFGITGDLPVVADYDGDGKSDIAIFRPSGSEWWLLRSMAGLFAAQFGSSGDKPTPGDYTGDGKADMAFFRPASAEWFVLRSEDFSFFAFPFGISTDTPVPGDYDGDGRFDAAVFRPSESTWYVNRSTAGYFVQPFGIAGDIPLPSVYIP